MLNPPPCEYRVDTPISDEYFCRHRRVHAKANLVSGAVCKTCPERTVHCENPRAVPTPEELDEAHELSLKDAPLRAFPPLQRQAWNFLKSVKDFVGDGMRTVTNGEYEARLQICDGCRERVGNRCQKCGCNLALKARGRAFDCPLGLWSSTSDDADPEM